MLSHQTTRNAQRSARTKLFWMVLIAVRSERHIGCLLGPTYQKLFVLKTLWLQWENGDKAFRINATLPNKNFIVFFQVGNVPLHQQTCLRSSSYFTLQIAVRKYPNEQVLRRSYSTSVFHMSLDKNGNDHLKKGMFYHRLIGTVNSFQI